jgi:protein AroM
MRARKKSAKVAFVTIGQAPRDDLLPEMRTWMDELTAVEFGALDGLTADEIARAAPGADDHALVSRLRDGGEVTLSKTWTRGRLAALMERLDADAFDLIVLLCTGHFEGVRSRTLMVEAQRVVDAGVEAVAGDGRTVGVMVPLARQMDEFHVAGVSTRSGGEPSGYQVVMAHASPYSDRRVEDAARDLAKADLIVMHCMGYTDAMRRRVAEVSGKPVLLARRLVASAVAQLVA